MSSRPEEPLKRAPNALWAVAVIFLLVAAGLAFDLIGSVASVQEVEPVDLKFVEKSTVRDPLDDAPRYINAGFEYNCTSCHEHFELGEDRGDRIAEHTDMVFNHGANDRCMNCHNKQNIETFVAHDGSEIAWTDSVQLCRKCHGPKYRDWVAGVHGRPNGYWDQARGTSIKATCVACHSPHDPEFKPIAPAPGPRERRGAHPSKATHTDEYH